jgi:hypothetical protein
MTKTEQYKMKKLLLAPAMLCAVVGAKAQLALQNFNSGIPSSWTMINVDGNTPQSGFVPRIITTLGGSTGKAWINWPVATGDSALLTVSSFDPVGKADRWIITPSFTVSDPKMIITWEDYAAAGTTTWADSIQVLVSPTAGSTTASFTTTIYNDMGGLAGMTKKGASLAAFSGQTIKVAFRDASTNKYVLFLDNIQTETPTYAADMSVDSVAIPAMVSGAVTNPVKVYVTNHGYANITSAEINYVLDAGTPVTQTFTGLSIPPYGSAILTFTTPLASGLALGTHSVVATLTQSNGAADPVVSNNTKSTTFIAATKAVTRAGLIEEFTSSTCVPCAGFNATFDPLITSSTNNANVASSNFNVLKYQMNWPSPGTDPSYNTPGVTRRAYYGVSSIPMHFTNGGAGGNGDQAEIDASKVDPSFMDISGTFNVTGDSLKVSVSVTPYFTLSSMSTRVRIAIAEKHYTYTGTTTQREFYHVMRNMLPDANGTAVASWTTGTAQTFTFAAPYTVGGVAQGNTNFWSDPVNSNMVVFIQDDKTGAILQSKVVPAVKTVSIGNIFASVNEITVYPNPATSVTNVNFNLAEASKVNITLLDATGKVVNNVTDAAMTAGKQSVQVNTSNLATGSYLVKIATDKGSFTQPLSVVK